VLKTFTRGGVHPPENKLSAHQDIREIPVTGTISIPLAMHLGVPAKPVVEKGSQVKIGQLIAKGNGFVSANIHSPVAGKVTKIDLALNSSGYKREAIYIAVEGEEWEESIDRTDKLVKECTLSSEEILQKINDAGIVGLGGATFPSHVKLTLPRGKSASYLIINGVECEPYLTADHVLMMSRSAELLTGIEILKRALNVNTAIIGIESNKPDAIKKLQQLAEGYSGISVQPLKVKYPQGGEKQLIKAVLDREVPSGALPVDVGTVVFNVGTAFAVYEAVQKNKPLIERIVTVTGKAIKNPSNFKVRIGTPIKELIEAAGGLPEDTGKVINGGPMMGKALASTDIPVVKGSSGILVLPAAESKRKPVEPCIRCTKCVSVCPMGLEPYLLMAMGQRSLYDRLEKDKVMDCIECGSCSYICPSNRPLLDYIRLGKSEVGNIIRSRKK
jgi:electron transport complex protein RnfC